MAKPAPSELVVSAWLGTIPGIAPAIVGTQLPEDPALWPTGFVQVGPEFGGRPGMYVPMREPVMEIHTWGVNPDTDSPDWQAASDLAELVVEAAYANHNLNNALTLPVEGYRQGRVLAAWPVTDPRRVRDDVASYGHFTLDLMVRWIEIPE